MQEYLKNHEPQYQTNQIWMILKKKPKKLFFLMKTECKEIVNLSKHVNFLLASGCWLLLHLKAVSNDSQTLGF